MIGSALRTGGRRRARAASAPLIRFAVAVIRGETRAARLAAVAARRAGWKRRAVEEVALMLIPNAGFPAGLEALRTLAIAWPGRARRTREGGPVEWRRRGEQRCARVYGSVTGRLLASLEALHPDVAAWVIEMGYGRMLARPGLPAAERELVAVAVLAAGGWERQVVSHLRGAGRMGAPSAAIREALRIGLRGANEVTRAAGARAWRTAIRSGG